MVQRVLDDPYSDEILNSIPSEVRKTFTTEQRVALKEAICKGRCHGIDIRFVVPLFFTQLYVVFLVGKDRRHSTHAATFERRVHAQRMSTAAVLALLGLAVLIGLLVVLYIAKSAAGINLMPHAHLKDAMRQIGL